jgi:hypothetical protein
MSKTLTLLLALSLPTAAWAFDDFRMHEWTDAGEMLQASFELRVSERVEITLEDATGPHVIRVWREDSNYEIAAAKGDAANPAFIEFGQPGVSGGEYRVFVYAMDAKSAGKGTLVHRGDPTRWEWDSLTQGEITAYPHEVPCDNWRDEIYEVRVVRWHDVTVDVTNDYRDNPVFYPGAEDPMMLLLGVSEELIDISYDGQGIEPVYDREEAACTVVPAAEPGTRAGKVDLYANDAWNDRDRDRIGARLEEVLGTCDDQYTNSWCSPAIVPNFADYERDGIIDGDEIFGMDDGNGTPQYLPLWGAEIRHTDIFVEVDWQDGVTAAQRATFASKFTDAQSMFAVAPGHDVFNQDALDGVNLHFDLAGIGASGTLYGDWGGSDKQDADHDYHDDSNMPAERNNVFHYMLIETGGTGQGVNGGSTLYVKHSRNGEDIAHEMGHNLGLGHHGADAWGEVNCKPNYVSLMNYAYGGVAAFSLGDHPIASLNPSSVDEGIDYDTPFLDLMDGAPWNFTVIGDNVDWNHDGLITDGPVRGMPNWASFESCRTQEGNNEIVQESVSLDPVTPSLFALDGFMYMTWLDAGLPFYSVAAIVDGGLDASCTGDDTLDADCLRWSSPALINDGSWAKSSSVAQMDVAAYGSTVVAVVVSAIDGEARALQASPGRGGVLSDWTPSGSLGIATVLEPELVTLDIGLALTGGSGTGSIGPVDVGGSSTTSTPITPSIDVGSERLGLFFLDAVTGEYQYLVTEAPTVTWSAAEPVLDATGQPLTGSLGPSLLDTDHDEFDELCGIFPDDTAVVPATAATVRLFCVDPDTGLWDDYSAGAFGRNAPMTVGKVGMAYHVARNADGTTEAGAPQGQLHLVTLSANDTKRELPVLWVSEPVLDLANGSWNIDFQRSGHFGNQWTDTLGTSGVVLYEDDSLTALKSAMKRGPSTHEGTDETVRFLPTADGSLDTEM